MSTRQFVGGVALICVTMAIAAAIEALVPLYARLPGQRRRTQANLGLTVLTMFLNWAFTSAAAVIALALPLQRPGLMERLGFPVLVELVLSVAVLDFFFGYVAHRAMHLSPLLWRVHRVHHSDPFVDVTTAYRTHPIEVLWRFLFMLVPIWLLGIPADAVAMYRLLSAINAALEHANIRPWPALDAMVSIAWVTPNMHKVHHSQRRPETNSNYGNLFSLYDRVFRTFTPTARASTVIYGLEDADPIRGQSLAALLSLPFEVGTPPESRSGADGFTTAFSTRHR